jgi:hypothetical protein
MAVKCQICLLSKPRYNYPILICLIPQFVKTLHQGVAPSREPALTSPKGATTMDLRELAQQYRALRAAAFQTEDDGQAEDLIYQCCELQLAIYHAPVNSFDDLVAKANVLTIDLKDGAEHSLPLEPASVLLMFVRNIEHLAASSNV